MTEPILGSTDSKRRPQILFSYVNLISLVQAPEDKFLARFWLFSGGMGLLPLSLSLVFILLLFYFCPLICIPAYSWQSSTVDRAVEMVDSGKECHSLQCQRNHGRGPQLPSHTPLEERVSYVLLWKIKLKSKYREKGTGPGSIAFWTCGFEQVIDLMNQKEATNIKEIKPQKARHTQNDTILCYL